MDPRDNTGPGAQELLSAHSVLPEQFWDVRRGHAADGGERALMWAVLADGIDCYQRNARATSAQQRLEFLEAERWIFRTDWDWPFSFVNLCELFGLEPRGVRQALVRGNQERTVTTSPRQRFRPVALHAA